MDEIIEFDTSFPEREDDESIVDYYFRLRPDLGRGSEQSVMSSWRTLHRYIDEKNHPGFEQLNKQDILLYIKWLRNQESVNKESYVENRVQTMSAMVSWFNSRGIISGNPFKGAIDTNPFEDTTPDPKVHVPLSELREAVLNIENPVLLVAVVTLLKTGLRIGELVNLDERDIHLDHPISGRLDDPRVKIHNKPDSIYVDSSVTVGEEANGELRSDSNKPDSTRVIPLDPEVKDVLVWYLAMRPTPVSNANPILVWNNGDAGRAGIGYRVSADGLRGMFNDWSDKNGWYSPEPHTVKPHWCRHWFTTTIRTELDRESVEVGTGDDYEEFMRGDTSTDTKKKYLQMNWGSNTWMRKCLVDAMPQLFVDTDN